MNRVSLTLIEREEKIIRMQAEVARLRESSIRATELAIITTTPEGIITSFNKAAEKLTGFHAIYVIGKVTPTTFDHHIELLGCAEAINAELGVEREPGFGTLIYRPPVHAPDSSSDLLYIR